MHALGQAENGDWQKKKTTTLTSVTDASGNISKFKCRIFTMQKQKNKYYFEQ